MFVELIMFNIVLFEPEIPPNTGNILRLAVNTGCIVHLIKPLGFTIDDKQLQRAGLDYIPKANYLIHQDFTAFLLSNYANQERIFLCSTKASTIYNKNSYLTNDTFIFGPETRGLPASLLASYPENNKLYIPMKKNGRSLNLATAVAIIIYEAWSQLAFQ